MQKEMIRLVCAKELAKTLSVSVRTIWRLKSAGRLPSPVLVGSSVRWRLSDIALYVQSDCDIKKFNVMKGGENEPK